MMNTGRVCRGHIRGWSPGHSYTGIDLINDESRKGSLRVHTLAVFVHGLFDDSLGVRAPAILIQNRLNQRRIRKG